MLSPSSKRFPLSASPFAPLRLSQPDESAIVNIANDLLVTTLVDYDMLHLRDGGVMPPAKWKVVKRFDNLVGYQKRRHRRKADKDQSPRLVWLGTLEGSLSDVMYGVINQNDKEGQTKAAYTKSNVVDFKVLASIVTATTSNPFKGLQIKWAVSASGLGLKRLVRLRDFVFLEATGVTRRASGESVGYHLIHSLSIPAIRHLPDYNLVRGSISLLHLFRETPSNTVELYTKESLDLMGNLRSRLGLYAACKTMEVVARLPLCFQHKKLAWMLRTSHRASPKKSNDYSSCHFCQKELRRMRHCQICADNVCSKCCRFTTLRFVDPYTCRLESRKMLFCTSCTSKSKHANSALIQVDELSQATWTVFTETQSTTSLSSERSRPPSGGTWSYAFVEVHWRTSISSSNPSRDSFQGLDLDVAASVSSLT
ncbi:hypothetical protein V7S43_013984 [Phytophthora oleae]|uniref:FYVE-type domain-containing protein n=1 Tax=Phytophthora oleae TaxID=2107226 RepID=A0ABD3F661_9STRA